MVLKNSFVSNCSLFIYRNTIDLYIDLSLVNLLNIFINSRRFLEISWGFLHEK